MKVKYIDHMGSDLSVVNAARVSFGKVSDWVEDRPFGQPGDSNCDQECRFTLSKADQGLIQFLARGCTSGDWETLKEDVMDAHGITFTYVDDAYVEQYDSEIETLLKHVKNMPTHWTPFGHTAVTLHIKAPIFVARQLGKHQTGLVWNEVSRRYVTDEPEFFMPHAWRKAADNVKQGSSDGVVNMGDLDEEVLVEMTGAVEMYEHLLEVGVCPEQARMVLPQSMYTEWYWTGNLYAFANVFIQRTDSHAQREVQEVAKQIGEIIEPLYPVSWKALTQ